MKLTLAAVAILTMATSPASASGDFVLEKVMVVGDAAPGTEVGATYAPFAFEYVPWFPPSPKTAA